MKPGGVRRNKCSCKTVKLFLKKHKHGLLDVALDEMADPALNFVNSHTHHVYELLSMIPPPSYLLTLYLLVLVITILA
jgi:hypothetical protein